MCGNAFRKGVNKTSIFGSKFTGGQILVVVLTGCALTIRLRSGTGKANSRDQDSLILTARRIDNRNPNPTKRGSQGTGNECGEAKNQVTSSTVHLAKLAIRPKAASCATIS